MREFQNFLIIGGTGRNVGKTTFCCNVLRAFTVDNRITAIKISNHFHEIDSNSCQILFANDDYMIVEERNFNSSKDTSRFLRAGADNSILILYKDLSLANAFEKLENLIDLKSTLILVESPSLNQILRPGVSILVTDDKNIKSVSNYDLIAHFQDDAVFDVDMKEIKVVGKTWCFA